MRTRLRQSVVFALVAFAGMLLGHFAGYRQGLVEGLERNASQLENTSRMISEMPPRHPATSPAE